MGRDGLIVEWVRQQFGLVTRRQALAAGLSEGTVEGRVAHGDWEVVGRGVYRMPGSVVTWKQRALALCLQSEPHAALSHRSAAWVLRLEGIGRAAPNPIELTIPRGHSMNADGVVHITRSPERFIYRGLPVTPVSRTLLDLAPTMSQQNLEIALDSALRLGRGARPALEKRLGALNPRTSPGHRMLRELMKARDGTYDSALEVLVRRALWAAGLPKPQVHIDVWHAGKWLANVDFAWPQQRLLVQAHGLKYHLNPRRYRIDQRQQSALAAAGWLPLTTTWEEVTHHVARFMECVKAAWREASSRSATRSQFPSGEEETAYRVEKAFG
jgi:very-short-patch-repair endonuclease